VPDTNQPGSPSPSQPDPSRRRFLAAAGASVAAAALGAGGCASTTNGNGESGGIASLFETPIPKAEPRVALEDGKPVRMGVIGTGGMGTAHCDAFMTLAQQGKENVQIVALADVCQSHLNRAYDKCTAGQKDVDVQKYADYRKLLERDDIHGVLIAAPEHWHSKMAIDAIAAGKDVYLEKPMTLKLPEALLLRRVVHANPDIRLQVGTQKTNLPKYLEAKKLIASGAIGVPTFSQTSYCRNSKTGEWNYYTIDPEWQPGVNLDWDAWCGPMGKRNWDPKVFARWRRYRDYSTGIIGDLLVHEITPMLMAIEQGWPTRVVATGSHLVDKEMENFDQVNLLVEFETGHQLAVAGSTCNEVGLETMIRGHKGNIYLGSRHCVHRPERIYSEEIEGGTIDCPDIGNDQDMHRLKWLKCIRTREQPDSDVEQGTKVMVMVDLAARSMWEGGAFAFNPKTQSVRRV
jgi:predicted dehydrogenase